MTPAARAISMAASRSARGSIASGTGVRGAMAADGIDAVGAVLAVVEARLGSESSGSNAGRGLRDPRIRLLEMSHVHGGAPDQIGVHEMELHPIRHDLTRLAIRQGVEAELAGVEALHRALHRALFLVDLAGLEVDDHDPALSLLDPVPAPAHHVHAAAKLEALLHLKRRGRAAVL